MGRGNVTSASERPCPGPTSRAPLAPGWSTAPIRTYELYPVPSDGSAPPVKVSHPLNGTRIHGDVAISPDSQRTRTSRTAPSWRGGRSLWSAPIDGSLRPSSGSRTSAPDPSWVGSRSSPTPAWRCLGPCDGTTVLSGDPIGVSPFTLTADGQAVLFLQPVSLAGPRELFVVPIDHDSPAVLLEPDLEPPCPVLRALPARYDVARTRP